MRSAGVKRLAHYRLGIRALLFQAVRIIDVRPMRTRVNSGEREGRAPPNHRQCWPHPLQTPLGTLLP